MPKEKHVFVIETWVSIIALITGIVSLFFSWQANQITFRLANSQVAILEIKQGTYGYDIYGRRAACQHNIRLTNLGGVPTAFIGYKVEFSYKDQRIELENTASHTKTYEDLLGAGLGDFQIVFLKDNLSVADTFIDITKQENWLTLPTKIEAFATLDIPTIINFWFDDTTHIFTDEAVPGVSPIQVIYILKFTPNQSVVSTPVNCFYAENN